MSLISGAAAYDHAPYPNLSYRQTHPDRLAALGTLLGMTPAPVDAARILELGTAGAGNIIPMAYNLPESSFLGIDYSQEQIRGGRQSVKELGLTNIRLETMDVREFPEDSGQFDYIIAHGLYSWVPEEVRDAILRLCRRHLAPQGIAYISYNVYPGWYLLYMLRGIMQYHARNETDQWQRASKAREMVEFLTEAVPAGGSPYADFIAGYASMLSEKIEQGQKAGDSLLLHDELAEINQPFYFHEFIEHANSHGLQYLIESEFSRVMPTLYPQQVIDWLMKMSPDIVALEQYQDFLANRTFRQTLLCHQEVEMTRKLSAEPLERLYFSSRVVPVSRDWDLSGHTKEQFRGQDGAVFTTDHPLSKAAFVELSLKSPRIFSFSELVDAATSRLGSSRVPDMEQHAKTLAGNLLRAYGYSNSLVEFHAHRPVFTTHISEKPVVFPIAQWQDARGMRVTNVIHERVTLDKLGRLLLGLLDGSRDRGTLLGILGQAYSKGILNIKVDDDMDPDQDEVAEILTLEMDKTLGFFARAALLVA